MTEENQNLKISFKLDETIKDYLYGKDEPYKILDVIKVDVPIENIKFN